MIAVSKLLFCIKFNAAKLMFCGTDLFGLECVLHCWQWNTLVLCFTVVSRISPRRLCQLVHRFSDALSKYESIVDIYLFTLEIVHCTAGRRRRSLQSRLCGGGSYSRCGCHR